MVKDEINKYFDIAASISIVMNQCVVRVQKPEPL